MLNVKAISILNTYSSKNTLASQPNQSNSPVYLNQPAKDEVSFKGVKDKLAEALARGAKPLTELLEAAKAKGEDEIIKEISDLLVRHKAKANKICFLDKVESGRLDKRKFINDKGETIRIAYYGNDGKVKSAREYTPEGREFWIYQVDGSISIIKSDHDGKPMEKVRLTPAGKEVERIPLPKDELLE